MAERALLSGDPGKAREIAERTLAFGRGASVEEPPYELAVLVEALAALEDWPGLAAVLPVARGRAAYLAWLGPAIDRAEAARLSAEGDGEGAGGARSPAPGGPAAWVGGGRPGGPRTLGRPDGTYDLSPSCPPGTPE